MPVALALSPHLDDAAFSCGGTLALLARRGWQVVLCTVFTASVDNPTGFALACQADKGVGPEIDYIGALLRSLAPDLLFAPQAIGGHVDHVAVVRALQALAPPEPIAWWRDAPYAFRDEAPAEPFREAMAALPEDQVVLTPEPLAAKRAACLSYASQIPFQFGGPEGLDATLARSGTVERFRLQGAVDFRPEPSSAASA
jgi:LmbE family N-acetylglucosaminyl deacetylase